MMTVGLNIFIIIVMLTSITGTINDDDENFYFTNNNNKFYFNNRRSCQTNYYYDVDFFKCRLLCDASFNLEPSAHDINKCVCDKSSKEMIEYDNILRRPVCQKVEGTKEEKMHPEKISCHYRYVNATKFSSLRKSVRIYKAWNNENCSCDAQLNEIYNNEYCIKKEILKDLKRYQHYKNLPLTQNLNLTYELKYLIFFCKILHRKDYCNYLANICTLTLFDLNKDGPCYPFYQQQVLTNGFVNDEEGIRAESEGAEFEGSEKLKPFLFFRNKKYSKNLFEKFIDTSYSLGNNVNNTLNFTIVAHDFYGNMTDFRPAKLGDINLCNMFPVFENHWQNNIRFAKNLYSRCTINLRDLAAYNMETKFSTLFLNYYENNANFIQTVPVLIRNAKDFDGNQNEDLEKWQLVKRFFLVDTISGRHSSSVSNGKNGDESRFYEQQSQITYAKSVELRFLLPDSENYNEINKIGERIRIPLLIIEYATLNLTSIANILKSTSMDYAIDESLHYNINFSFKIKFIKRAKFSLFFQIMLPIFLSLAFFYSLLTTFFYKIRSQLAEYFDFTILLNFVINLLSNLSNAIFATSLIFILWTFWTYKTQTSVVILLPLSYEETIIEILLATAVTFKTTRILKLFFDITHLDIFFIDWERPKYHMSDNLKSHPGTPSISSSLKPPALSPTNEFVSAWRNYFVANEWQELITKRKFSINLQVILVLAAIKLMGFENCSSIEFYLHLNTSSWQNYLDHYKLENESVDILNNNILLKVAVGAMVYLSLYAIQRLWNLLIYERFVDNCLQQFVDVSSIANISVLILINSYGFYIHGRSVHGRSDIDTFNMIIHLKREEENLCGQRGLLPGSDHQTYTILAPRNLRLFYEQLIKPLNKNQNHDRFNNQSMKFEKTFEKMMITYHNINRFFAAFIDHALKDVDYMIKEKNWFEKLFDCELESITDSKGVLYFDNLSFDKVLFYGNENTIFGFEFLLFVFVLFTTGNFLIATISVAILSKLIQMVINHSTKNNLARKTLIDKRFLI